MFSWLKGLFSVYKEGDSFGNIPSPRVNIDTWDIVYNPDAKTLTINDIEGNIKIETVQNSNSMEPLIDVGHTIVRSNAPKYLDDLVVGDIIVWQKGSTQKIHSIVEIGQDYYGWYCYTQGLNIPRRDTEKIRRHEIRDVALMAIWSKGTGYYKATNGD